MPGMRKVANNATIIRTTAPTRSDQGARLKNSHHRMTANPKPKVARSADFVASGATTGSPNLTSHCRITRTTPGHSRSGFRRVGSADCAIVMSDLLEIQRLYARAREIFRGDFPAPAPYCATLPQ